MFESGNLSWVEECSKADLLCSQLDEDAVSRFMFAVQPHLTSASQATNGVIISSTNESRNQLQHRNECRDQYHNRCHNAIEPEIEEITARQMWILIDLNVSTSKSVNRLSQCLVDSSHRYIFSYVAWWLLPDIVPSTSSHFVWVSYYILFDLSSCCSHCCSHSSPSTVWVIVGKRQYHDFSHSRSNVYPIPHIFCT